MVSTGYRQKSTRNNEFLKYVSTGAGLGHTKHCVLDADYFPYLPVDESMDRISTKKLARKGQVIVKHASNDRWGPLARTVVTESAASGDSAIVVADPTLFQVGQEIEIGAGPITRTIVAIDYDTSTLTLDSTLGGSGAAENAVVVYPGLGDDYTDMAVLGDEFDLSYGSLAGPGYHLNCFFNTDNLYGYAGNETQVQAGLPSCFFETLPDVTDV